jgi:hypothetical protein
MTRLLTACLLPLLCLLTRPASSQALAPLAPAVVRLEVGDVAQRPLIGLDTAAYRNTRQYVAAASQLLLVRADRITALERGAQLNDSVQATYAAELRRCRAGAAATEANYDRLRQAARVALASPPRPPLLLDGNFYKGAGAGAVLATLLNVFIFHH